MIRTCNEAIKGKKLNENVEESVPIKAVLHIVAQVRTLVDETPRDTESCLLYTSDAADE